MSKAQPMMETVIRRRVPTMSDVSSFAVNAAMTPPDKSSQQRQLVDDATGLPIWIVRLTWRWVGEDGTPAPILGSDRATGAFSIESEHEPTMADALARVVADLGQEWSMPGDAKRKARKRR